MRLLILVMAGLRRTPRRATCSIVGQLLYRTESLTGTMPSLLERHRAGCLVCQAETVRQRHVVRGLGALREETEAMPYDLAAALEGGIIVPHHAADASRPASRSSRNAIAGAAGAASLAAIGVVVAWRAKRAS